MTSLNVLFMLQKFFQCTPGEMIYDIFQVERKMIIVTVSVLIMNQTELKEKNIHYDHIHFNLKRIINKFLREYGKSYGVSST